MARIENSPGLDLAMERAKEAAVAEGRQAVSAADLLDGLLSEQESLPFDMLRQAGADLSGWSDRPARAASGVAGLSVSAAVRRILNRAREAVPWHSPEGTITTDLVLLALLEMDEAVREQLIRLGLDWERLQKEHPFEAPALELEEPLNLQPGADAVDLHRLLDACANRAREALRVLEDYTRFVMDDVFLTRELKTLRHDLVARLTPLSPPFLHARDTEEDVGASLSTQTETERHSLRHVVLVNAKRLHEALRSLEEYGKVHATELGQGMERLRYRAYTLERALVLQGDAIDRLKGARLYVLLSESACRASWIGTARELLEGGVDILQLREKQLDDRSLLERARELRKMTRDFGALFIVNDRPDIAALCDADGVHLGQDDLPVRAARRVQGWEALIGVSTHNLDQLRQAVLQGASYIGIGPTFPSHTKTFEAFAGLDFIRAASAETTLPAFALGGITLGNLPEVLAAGATRIAVSQSLCGADDPCAAAAEMKRRLVNR